MDVDNDNRTRMALNSGYNIDLLDLDIEKVDICTIAHSLSFQCRFNGHCKQFYSVADHSVRLSHRMGMQRPIMLLTALMHDSAEVFTGDIIRPVRNLIYQGTGVLDDIEKEILCKLAKKFGFTYPIPEIVKFLDNRLLVTEAKYLLPGDHSWWTKDLPDPFDEVIYPCPITLSCEQFIKRFEQLTKAIENDRTKNT